MELNPIEKKNRSDGAQALLRSAFYTKFLKPYLQRRQEQYSHVNEVFKDSKGHEDIVNNVMKNKGGYDAVTGIINEIPRWVLEDKKR